MSLDVFFYPETVAVIGASGRPGSFSHELLRNLARGFHGKVYAVNPKYREIAGVPSYPSILDVPGEVDLAVIALRAPRVPSAVGEAGRKGVKGVIVVSGGFAETGEEGARLQEKLLEAARKYSVRIVGPNCIGVYNAVNGLDTFFLPPEKMRRPPKGYIGVVSQSGAFLTMVMDWLAEEGIGIVKAINIGNKVDVDEAEVIDYYSGLEEVNTMMVYIEGVAPGRGRRLVDAIENARSLGKNVVVLKGGRTREGARAARSHTASLAGDYEVFKAALIDAGAVVVDSPSDFIDSAKALSLVGRLARGGERVLVVTNAGGPGVLAVDELEARGLRVPEAPKSIVERLRGKVPPIAALGNPIDLTGDAGDEDYKVVFENIGEDWYDYILVIAPVQPATMTIRVADIIADAAWSKRKPTVAVTIGADYGRMVHEYLESRGIPAYPLPDRAAAALATISRAAGKRCPRPETMQPPAQARRIIRVALSEGRTKLLAHEALALVEAYGVPVPDYCLATTLGEVEECAQRLGGRVVLKIVSPDIIHKSDVGGVVLHVDPSDAAAAAESMLEEVARRAPEARVAGILVQLMARPGGVEVIVGSRRDKYFGPITLLGLGGILVEALRDYSIALAPTHRCRVPEMVGSLRGSRLLTGYRHLPPRDIESLSTVVEAVSRITWENPEVSDVEINPLLVYEDGVLAVDARIML